MEHSFETDPSDFLSPSQLIEKPIKGLIYIEITGSSRERNFFGVIHPRQKTVTCITQIWPWFLVSLDYNNQSTRILITDSKVNRSVAHDLL